MAGEYTLATGGGPYFVLDASRRTPACASAPCPKQQRRQLPLPTTYLPIYLPTYLLTYLPTTYTYYQAGKLLVLVLHRDGFHQFLDLLRQLLLLLLVTVCFARTRPQEVVAGTSLSQAKFEHTNQKKKDSENTTDSE